MGDGLWHCYTNMIVFNLPIVVSFALDLEQWDTDINWHWSDHLSMQIVSDHWYDVINADTHKLSIIAPQYISFCIDQFHGEIFFRAGLRSHHANWHARARSKLGHVRMINGNDKWNIYGWFMDDLWMIYGWFMEHLWMIYGWFMDDLWIIYGYGWYTCPSPVCTPPTSSQNWTDDYRYPKHRWSKNASTAIHVCDRSMLQCVMWV